MSPAYPKFLLKVHSEILGGNICISLSGIHNKRAVLAVTIFDSTGEVFFDSFGLELPEEDLPRSIETADLIPIVEQMYLILQLERKNSVAIESLAAHVH